MDFPILMPRVKTTRHSGLIFHWRGSDLALASIAGQTATYSNVTTGTQDDTEGVTYTSVYSQPRWHWDTNLSVPTLRMTSGGVEQLRWAMNLTPREMTVYAAIVQTATHPSAGGVFFHIGHETNIATAPYFRLDVVGTGYTLVHNNNVTNRQVTLVMAPLPSVGEGVEIVARLQADGGVEIEVSIEGGTPQTDSAGTALTLASAWAGPYLHINSVVGSNRRNADYRSIKIAPGLRTFAEMRKAF